MGPIKKVVTKITNNPIGAIAGAVGGYYVAKKYGKVENKWLLIGSAVAGAFLGGMINSKIKAKAMMPKEQDVKAASSTSSSSDWFMPKK